MGLFGFGREPEREERPSARELAQAHYRELMEHFPADHLWLKTADPARPFPESSYRFAREGDTFLLLPELDVYNAPEDVLSRAEVRRYPASRLAVAKREPARTPTGKEGILQVYPIEPVTLLLSLDGGEPAAFTAHNSDTTAVFLKKYLPGCTMRTQYDLIDAPEDAGRIFCKKGGGLLPDSTQFTVWRDGDALHFLRCKAINYYTKEKDVCYGTLPVSAVESFEQKGQIDYETKVSGGGVSIDREGAMWGGVLGWNSNANMLESAIVSEPIRTERIEHDNRFAELRVRLDGRRTVLEFARDAAEVLEKLIPEKAAENLPGEREPTIPEQIEILANVCDRGYLTRAEFEAAKARLLARL